MNKTIPYKWDDFTVIGMTELNPFILTVSPDSPYQTFADFEKAVKEGAELTYSSAGVGTLLHIATAVMADAMGADPDKLTHVCLGWCIGGWTTSRTCGYNQGTVQHNS